MNINKNNFYPGFGGIITPDTPVSGIAAGSILGVSDNGTVSPQGITPPVGMALPFAAGYEEMPGRAAKYFKTREDVVILNFSCKKSNGDPLSSGAAVATLPAGCRPGVTLTSLIVCRNSSGSVSGLIMFSFSSSGNIELYGLPGGPSFSEIYSTNGLITFRAER